MKNGVKIFKKMSHLPFAKKKKNKNRLLAHCFDFPNNKTIISHLF